MMFRTLSTGVTDEVKARIKRQLESEYNIANPENVPVEDVESPTEEEMECALRVAFGPGGLGDSL